MKILKSKFYLVKDCVVHPEFGAFNTSTRAEAQMFYVAKRTGKLLHMERKPEFSGYHAVKGKHILASRVYTVAESPK